MAQAKLTPAQASFLRTARPMQKDQRQQVKRELFAVVKSAFGIPADHKLVVELDNPHSPTYLVLKSKTTGQGYDLGSDGRWVGATPLPSQGVLSNRPILSMSVDEFKSAIQDWLDEYGDDDNEPDSIPAGLNFDDAGVARQGNTVYLKGFTL